VDVTGIEQGGSFLQSCVNQSKQTSLLHVSVESYHPGLRVQYSPDAIAPQYLPSWMTNQLLLAKKLYQTA
jgi:hypothetical protein